MDLNSSTFKSLFKLIIKVNPKKLILQFNNSIYLVFLLKVETILVLLSI